MKRAGQGSKRKRSKERKLDILEAVIVLTQRGQESVTLARIAEYLGLTASSHLMKLAKEMWVEDRISCTPKKDNRVLVVYRFSVTRKQRWQKLRLCDMPIDCSRANPQVYADACKDETGRLCSAQGELAQSEETAMRAGEENGYIFVDEVNR